MQATGKLLEEARRERRSNLLEPEAKAICVEYGIPVGAFRVAKSLEEALHAAAEIGFPVVLKVISPQIVHKSEAGGVITRISNVDELRAAYDRIIENVSMRAPNAKIEGVLVEEMAPSGIEVIVGSTKDRRFGPVLMFGLGGILVEVLKDTTFRVPPITDSDAREMITGIKGYKVLEGYRGHPPADTTALVDILLRVSSLLVDHPEIREIDLNPIMAYSEGARTVDARMILD